MYKGKLELCFRFVLARRHVLRETVERFAEDKLEIHVPSQILMVPIASFNL